MAAIARGACAAAGGQPAHLPLGAGRAASARRWRRSSRRCPGLLLVAGRYEGIDERVVELGIDRESVDRRLCAVRRRAAGAGADRCAGAAAARSAGDERSSVEESFVAGLLDWPHYTRPEVFEGRRVPAVLMSGDHAAIRRWRLEQAFGRTWQRRPELMAEADSRPRRGAHVGRISERTRGCGPRPRRRDDAISSSRSSKSA